MGAKIVSMSLGGPSLISAEQSTTNTLHTNGMLLIAAAGNAGNNAVSYPAGYANVISIAAIDSANGKAGFSQVNADVELSAPGVDVLSTVYAMATITSPTATNFADWMDASVRTNVSVQAARCTISRATTTCPTTATGKHCCCDTVARPCDVVMASVSGYLGVYTAGLCMWQAFFKKGRANLVCFQLSHMTASV
jgi:hypothetical protein